MFDQELLKLLIHFGLLHLQVDADRVVQVIVSRLRATTRAVGHELLWSDGQPIVVEQTGRSTVSCYPTDRARQADQMTVATIAKNVVEFFASDGL
jgi:hypothetical protein